MYCLVVYDIADNAVRGRVADVCFDYGLARIQLSTFLGPLEAPHQDELYRKISRRLAGRDGNVQVFTICDGDMRRRRTVAGNAKKMPPPPAGSRQAEHERSGAWRRFLTRAR